MLLLTPQEVLTIAFSPSTNLLPEAIRESKIDVAQEYFLRPKFGDLTFESILAGAHTEYVDTYLKSALAYYVRYGMLEELAVGVDENGLVVFLGGNDSTSRSASDTRSVSDSATASATDKRTDTLKTLSTEEKKQLNTGLDTTDVERSESVTSSDSQTKTTDSTTDKQTVIGVEPVDKTKYDSTITVNDTVGKDSSVTDIETKQTSDQIDAKTTKEDTKTDTTDTTKTSESEKESLLSATNSTESALESRRFRPAAESQVRTLKLRALSDANILINKALRYVELHLEEFPDYVPRQKFYF